MNRIFTASAFAASVILLALGTAYGVIPAETGEMLLIVMPALAIAAMGSKRCCNVFGQARA